jgi:two-component system sensor histidine kinase KdpD
MRQMAAVSESLVADEPVESLLRSIVATARTVFGVPGAALLQLRDGRLVVVASAGEPLTEQDLARLDPASGRPVSVGPVVHDDGGLRAVALSSAGRAVAMLALRGEPEAPTEREVLATFANDAAVALERARLREEALRAQLLEEADRFRHGLMGAVSHDLRTPLATIKVASSTLLERGASLSPSDAEELHRLIDVEADRLTRMVTNLLDLSRLEAGVLTLHREATTAGRLIDDALAAVRTSLSRQRVVVEVDPDVPTLAVDPGLMNQVLVNLLDNALRHGPPTGTVTITAARRGPDVVLSICDEGPGVPEDQREAVFNRFTQFDTGGARDSGSRSPEPSSRPTGGASGVTPHPAAAPASASPSPRPKRRDGSGPGHRRRPLPPAGAPARARGERTRGHCGSRRRDGDRPRGHRRPRRRHRRSRAP